MGKNPVPFSCDTKPSSASLMEYTRFTIYGWPIVCYCVYLCYIFGCCTLIPLFTCLTFCWRPFSYVLYPSISVYVVNLVRRIHELVFKIFFISCPLGLTQVVKGGMGEQEISGLSPYKGRVLQRCDAE